MPSRLARTLALTLIASAAAVQSASSPASSIVVPSISFRTLPYEADYAAIAGDSDTRAAVTTLYSCHSRHSSGIGEAAIASGVPRAFARDVALRTSQGVLNNGAIVYRQCACTESFQCFGILDSIQYPYGRAEHSRRPWQPFVSLTVPSSMHSVLRVGDTVLLRSLIGQVIPGTAVRHNGCLVVDDMDSARISALGQGVALFILKESLITQASAAIYGGNSAAALTLEKTACTPPEIGSILRKRGADGSDGLQSSPIASMAIHYMPRQLQSDENDSDEHEPLPDSGPGVRYAPRQLLPEENDSDDESLPYTPPGFFFPNPTEEEIPRAPAEQCIQEQNCHLPNCRCFTLNAPGDLQPAQIPMFITITWDDFAFLTNINNYIAGLEKEALRDAGGCYAHSTFFTTWQYDGIVQDMVALRRLSKAGNSIGLHTFSHNTDEQVTLEEWRRQSLASQCAARAAGITMTGSRAPYLKWNDNYLAMLRELRVPYDSSQIIDTYSRSNEFAWPNTLNWGVNQLVFDALQPPSVQSRSAVYPGVWEYYLNELLEYGSRTDSVGTSMDPPALTEAEIYNILQWNFELHYNSTSRAPFGIFWHLYSIESWNPALYPALVRFLTNVLRNHKDVFFATIPQVISWVQNPVPLPFFHGFGCTGDRSVLDSNPCDGMGSTSCSVNGGISGQQEAEYTVCGTRCPSSFGSPSC